MTGYVLNMNPELYKKAKLKIKPLPKDPKGGKNAKEALKKKKKKEKKKSSRWRKRELSLKARRWSERHRNRRNNIRGKTEKYSVQKRDRDCFSRVVMN